jgi:predicted hydrocarbon binding protein
VSDALAIPAILPLSLLEAIRNLDTPVEDGLEVLAHEIVARRLGLSTTVAAQIERYRETAEREGTVSDDELVAVLRLVGRRHDAGLVFADAGRRAARHTIRAGGRSARALLKVSPSTVGRRVGLRTVRRLASTYFRGELGVKAGETEFRMSAALSVSAMPDGSACAFYGAAYGELLRSLTDFEGAMTHEHCRGRGDPVCVWRAERAGGYE